jgi:uncharacterized repeat protein (TIGR01451 family)
MKKIPLLLIIMFSVALHCQIINIPDTNFKTALIESGIDTNNNGEIEVEEAQVVTELKIGNRSIVDLQGISYFSNLIYLVCSDNNIEYLDISELIKLEHLNIDWNYTLKSLKLPESSNLVKLECFNNDLTSLDLTNQLNLIELDCSNNKLLELDVSKNSRIKKLYCSDNNLKNLDLKNLNDLTELFIGYNEFSTIINIPNKTNLTSLNYAGYNFTSFDTTNMPNLEYLNLDDNKLTEINITQNPKLRHLSINNNQISTLDLSNLKELVILECDSNKLTKLNVSELEKLIGLLCSDNLLKTLDLSKNYNLQFTEIHNNLLETLFIKNGFQEVEQNHYNTISYSILKWWNYGGREQTLKYVCTDNFSREIRMFKSSGITVNPYCSFTPGGDYYTLKGEIQMSNSVNSCDANSLNFSDLKLKITYDTGDSDFYSVDEDGTYEINLPEGEYIVEPQLLNPSYFSTSINSFTVNFPNASSPYVQDICIASKGSFNDVEISIIPIDEARPGFDADYKIVYKNVGTTKISGNINLTFNDIVLDFISSNTSINSQNVGELNWVYTDLEPTEKREILYTMNLNSPTETPPLNSGDILTYNAVINPTENEEVVINNLFTLNQEVVNSYDPNDKTCLQGNFATPDIIGEYAHYLIRFENLGTASAINVVVKDIIDTEKFDISTLEVYNYSHPLKTRVQNTNEVEFIFEAINLPFDDANNDGYVAFKIKTLPTLKVGDILENFAEIYFDYNPEIVTNTAKTSIESPAKIDQFYFNASIKLFPKPTSDFINILSNKFFDRIDIYDLKGSLLKTINFIKNTNKSRISVNNLSKGIYLINIKSGDLKKSMRFIKD